MGSFLCGHGACMRVIPELRQAWTVAHMVLRHGTSIRLLYCWHSAGMGAQQLAQLLQKLRAIWVGTGILSRNFQKALFVVGVYRV